MSTTTELPAELKRKAKKELHEEEKHVEAHLDSFRRWVKALPHITCPTDSRALIPFLRHAKYVHSKAQARLDNFCTLRGSEELGVPDLFRPIPLNDPIVDEFLRAGIFLDLGRTEEHVTVVLLRFDAWDENRLHRDDLRRMRHMEVDRILSDPVAQVGGFVIIFDLTGVSSNKIMKTSDRKQSKVDTKIWQEGYPIRVKHLIFYNEPSIMDALFKFLEPWWTKKIRERMVRIKNNLQKAIEKVPGLEMLLPEEYGGYNSPLKDLIVEHEKKFRNFYAQPSPWAGIRVNESLRPNTAKNYMREYKDIKSDLFGMDGTFVKIDPGD